VEQSSIQPVRGLQSTAAGREFGGRYISLLRGHFHPSPQGMYSLQLSLFTFNLIFELLNNTLEHLSLILAARIISQIMDLDFSFTKVLNCFLRTFSRDKSEERGSEKSHFHSLLQRSSSEAT
jgi:hypothetical protein